MNLKKIRRTFNLQLDTTDCGIACLLALVQLHGSNASRKSLRELSGTNRTGTTLLGLCQAAKAIGLEATGLKADKVDDLKTLKNEAILHIYTEFKRPHYILFYGYKKGQFIIGDPAKGIIKMKPEELDSMWHSRALLSIKPTPKLKKTDLIRQDKWNWIYQLIKEDFPILSIGVFLGVLTTILGLSTAFFTQTLIDHILPEGNKNLLFLGIGALVLLLTCKVALLCLRDYFILRQSISFNNRITRRFFHKLLQLPKMFFDTHKTGEFVARLNDTARIQRTISLLANKAIIDFFVVVVSLIYILIFSPVIAGILFTGIILYFVLSWYYSADLLQGQKAVMASYAKNESNYIDTIQAIETIKTANQENFFSHINKIVYGLYQRNIFQLGKIKISFSFVAQVLGTMLSIAIIGWCSWLVLNNKLLLGEMMAIMFIATGCVPAAISLAMLNIRLQETKVAFDRMFEFVLRTPEYKWQKANQSTPIFENLRVKNLSFRFPGRQQLLRSISFELNRAEIIGFVGETGCGKSITLQILQKFYRPESGNIQFNQTEWASISPGEWRNLIAVVPQQITFFAGSIFDNIRFGQGYNEMSNQQGHRELNQEVIAFCKEYGFDTFFKQFPQSYATLVGKEGIQLSGGQMQLLALARALFQRPQVLILDEPVASMDRTLRIFVVQLLQRLRKNGMSIIIATHRMEMLGITDRVYWIQSGRSTVHPNAEQWVESS